MHSVNFHPRYLIFIAELVLYPTGVPHILIVAHLLPIPPLTFPMLEFCYGGEEVVPFWKLTFSNIENLFPVGTYVCLLTSHPFFTLVCIYHFSKVRTVL